MSFYNNRTIGFGVKIIFFIVSERKKLFLTIFCFPTLFLCVWVHLWPFWSIVLRLKYRVLKKLTGTRKINNFSKVKELNFRNPHCLWITHTTNWYQWKWAVFHYWSSEFQKSTHFAPLFRPSENVRNGSMHCINLIIFISW